MFPNLFSIGVLLLAAIIWGANANQQEASRGSLLCFGVAGLMIALAMLVSWQLLSQLGGVQ